MSLKLILQLQLLYIELEMFKGFRDLSIVLDSSIRIVKNRLINILNVNSHRVFQVGDRLLHLVSILGTERLSL